MTEVDTVMREGVVSVPPPPPSVSPTTTTTTTTTGATTETVTPPPVQRKKSVESISTSSDQQNGTKANETDEDIKMTAIDTTAVYDHTDKKAVVKKDTVDAAPKEKESAAEPLEADEVMVEEPASETKKQKNNDVDIVAVKETKKKVENDSRKEEENSKKDDLKITSTTDNVPHQNNDDDEDDDDDVRCKTPETSLDTEAPVELDRATDKKGGKDAKQKMPPSSPSKSSTTSTPLSTSSAVAKAATTSTAVPVEAADKAEKVIDRKDDVAETEKPPYKDRCDDVPETTATKRTLPEAKDVVADDKKEKLATNTDTTSATKSNSENNATPPAESSERKSSTSSSKSLEIINDKPDEVTETKLPTNDAKNADNKTLTIDDDDDDDDDDDEDDDNDNDGEGEGDGDQKAKNGIGIPATETKPVVVESKKKSHETDDLLEEVDDDDDDEDGPEQESQSQSSDDEEDEAESTSNTTSGQTDDVKSPQEKSTLTIAAVAAVAAAAAAGAVKQANGIAIVRVPELDTVTLDDDTDDEEDDGMIVDDENVPNKARQMNVMLNKSKEQDSNLLEPMDISMGKNTTACSDSDGAVVIGSDSEPETGRITTHTSLSIKAAALASSIASSTAASAAAAAAAAQAASAAALMIDDDDDDCVVIEDDKPATIMGNDLSKRKNLSHMDAANSSDDSQPPSKRQRSGISNFNHPTGLNQITIKDTRSLLQQDIINVTKKVGGVGGGMDVNIYPINLTSAPTTAGPPKLVPVSNNSGMNVASLHAGIGTANANLLPGLTDDMFVLEAPSFIVPYIYEKPPSDVLRNIVRDIEQKYELSKEDLADADKSDEFDMMTEQNKDDSKEQEKNSKKRKKQRGGEEVDDSWSEDTDEDEDDDDDDDSEGGVRTKVLIKEASDDLTALKGAIKPAAAVVAQSICGGIPNVAGQIAKPGQENYFESPLGKFFMDIGVGLVQEFVQSDLIRLQKRKMRKSLGKNITEFERAITALSGNLEASKKKNSAYKFTMKRCEFCTFKSESALAMANHYETPHMNGQLYKCNFCTFEIRNATEIVYHMEAMHNIKARLIKPLPYHQCPNCGFEDNGKAKLGRHQPVCAKKFRPELNLSPPNDWEAPAKIPRIKPRHGLVGTATAYQAMAAQAAAHKAALASLQQQQQQVAHARTLQAAALAAQNAANKIRGRPPVMTKPGPTPVSVPRGAGQQVRSPMAATNVMLTNNYHVSGGQLIQAALNKKSATGQPSISITPLPRQSIAPQASSPSTSKVSPTPTSLKPAAANANAIAAAGVAGSAGAGGGKAQFVICEICDGYIKDLEQLRNHMQWMHKVKIHPKMIYNRPPLNCQKCQFRFFTDQGLERHLLGSHGLVTSSMQEAANKGRDAGRCPVCGKMYQWKLLNHVSRDHHMTLKPAHLSYKCTVCTATFGMYKQFETHVYTAHSTVAKKAIDGKKANNNSTATGTGSGATTSGSGGLSNNQRISLGAANDSLLKPLKINDEITIIPQPSSKPRIVNMESHVID